MTPLKGYYEEPHFKKILAVANCTCQHKIRKVGFCRHAFRSYLPVEICQAIERETVYTPDMDVAWFDFNLPIEINERLEKLAPKFQQAFNSKETL